MEHIKEIQSFMRLAEAQLHEAVKAYDMKQLEIQRLKKLAMERPPKIRRYSFLLLACMLMIYMGVMVYQILGTMSGMF